MSWLQSSPSIRVSQAAKKKQREGDAARARPNASRLPEVLLRQKLNQQKKSQLYLQKACGIAPSPSPEPPQAIRTGTPVAGKSVNLLQREGAGGPAQHPKGAIVGVPESVSASGAEGHFSDGEESTVSRAPLGRYGGTRINSKLAGTYPAPFAQCSRWNDSEPGDATLATLGEKAEHKLVRKYKQGLTEKEFVDYEHARWAELDKMRKVNKRVQNHTDWQVGRQNADQRREHSRRREEEELEKERNALKSETSWLVAAGDAERARRRQQQALERAELRGEMERRKRERLFKEDWGRRSEALVRDLEDSYTGLEEAKLRLWDNTRRGAIGRERKKEVNQKVQAADTEKRMKNFDGVVEQRVVAFGMERALERERIAKARRMGEGHLMREEIADREAARHIDALRKRIEPESTSLLVGEEEAARPGSSLGAPFLATSHPPAAGNSFPHPLGAAAADLPFEFFPEEEGQDFEGYPGRAATPMPIGRLPTPLGTPLRGRTPIPIGNHQQPPDTPDPGMAAAWGMGAPPRTPLRSRGTLPGLGMGGGLTLPFAHKERGPDILSLDQGRG